MPASLEDDLIGTAWAAVTADDDGTAPPRPARVEVTGPGGRLPSRFAVEETAVACVAAALLAAAALAGQRGAVIDTIRLDRGHVADAVRSERFFSAGAAPGSGASFARLSRFWTAADGWVRTHANYPWHRRALVEALGTSEDVEAVASAMVELPAEVVEERVFEAGGIATAVRTIDTWRAHPQGRAVAAERLVGHRTIGDSAPRARAAADLPLTDVRVLDLTRVIAGPVCTRLLGALGADVLRLDPPGHRDMAPGVAADTLLGKRSSFVDLGSEGGVATLHGLLAGADVVVCGYRPGALDRFGLDEASLAERHPGIVGVFLDAWGHGGPWAGRRGFDSVVQGPTGIAHGESVSGDGPGAMPCQLLDHGTGYLAAAAAMDGLRRQAVEGGTQIRRLSLARTAWWLTSNEAPRREPPAASGEAPGGGPWVVGVESTGGPVTVVSPPGALGDRPLAWPFPLTGYADDPATWSTASASGQRGDR